MNKEPSIAHSNCSVNNSISPSLHPDHPSLYPVFMCMPAFAPSTFPPHSQATVEAFSPLQTQLKSHHFHETCLVQKEFCFMLSLNEPHHILLSVDACAFPSLGLSSQLQQNPFGPRPFCMQQLASSIVWFNLWFLVMFSQYLMMSLLAYNLFSPLLFTSYGLQDSAE